jgi:hypothetical protein
MKTRWGYVFTTHATYPSMWSCDLCSALVFSPDAHSEWHVEQNHRINSAAGSAWVDGA